MRLIILMIGFLLLCSNPTSYDSKVPEDANIKYGRISQKTIPSGWTTVAPWMIAVHNPKLGNSSQVQVRYLRLYSVSFSGEKELIVEKDYSKDSFSPTTDGGMYTMYPSWFCDDKHTPMSGASVISSSLTFNPSSDKNHIWHWWTDRVLLPSNSAYIIVEARIFLSGAACVQMGADWWRTFTAQWNGLNVNNTEVGTTDGYFADSKGEIMPLGSPDWETLCDKENQERREEEDRVRYTHTCENCGREYYNDDIRTDKRSL